MYKEKRVKFIYTQTKSINIGSYYMCNICVNQQGNCPKEAVYNVFYLGKKLLGSFIWKPFFRTFR